MVFGLNRRLPLMRTVRFHLRPFVLLIVCGVIGALVVVRQSFGSVDGSTSLESTSASFTEATSLKIRVIRKLQQGASTDGLKPAEGAQEAKPNSADPSCLIPDLDINNPEIAKVVRIVEPRQCAKEPNWVYVENGTFRIDPKVQERHQGGIKCNVSQFWRVTDAKITRVRFENVTDGWSIPGDFFEVDCIGNPGTNYKGLHAGVKVSDEAVKRSKELNPSSSGYNVYILGFDTLSRLFFMRKLPKLYSYLTEKLGAVVLKGYNIVGDGTPQALIPMLTGKTEVELPLTRKRYGSANYVDVYPFVWYNYSDAGYITLYGEDAAKIGTFTYRLKGFDKQPTDHYMRTFYHVLDERGFWEQFCLGSVPHHLNHFRYVEEFFKAYPSLPKFAFQFHSLYSHDDFNRVGWVDADMVKHLEFLRTSGNLENTILMVMSDHGPRFAEMRETQQGKLEERLPFFSVVLPEKFRKEFPVAYANLRQNADRLTSPFDIHPTLMEILNPRSPKDSGSSPKNRGISLLDEIPKNRSCAQAGIEAHWCACLTWEPMPVTDPLIRNLADSVVAVINEETEKERKLCAPLRLEKIDRVLKFIPEASVMKYKQSKDKDGFIPDLSGTTAVSIEIFQLTFRTVPGGALYEATVNLDRKISEVRINLDDVSHINRYGDLPHCVIDKDYFLAKWCVCYDKIDKRA